MTPSKKRPHKPILAEWTGEIGEISRSVFVKQTAPCARANLVQIHVSVANVVQSA